MQNDNLDLYYSDYLELDKLLSAQHPESAKRGTPAHEETLFIITHQAYELWFKQILHELASILALFAAVPLNNRALIIIIARLERIVAIQKVINQQLDILETMTPLDFLDFRDYLTPASGFQSVQFREIELRLGLSTRLGRASFSRFCEKDRHYLENVTQQSSLLKLVDAWLCRMPYVEFGEFNFWQSYRTAVDKMLYKDAAIIRKNPLLTNDEIARQLTELERTRHSFEYLFDKQQYRKHKDTGSLTLSYEATLAALFIRLYRDEPLLQPPFRLLNCLMAIDHHLIAWRSGHMIMVHRMLGTKIGTGGSSGQKYLQGTISEKRIFSDLFNLSTYLIPRSQLPELPENLRRNLGYYDAKN